MAIKIIRNRGEAPLWMSTDGSSKYYLGQIVSIVAASKAAVSGGAVKPLAVPAGAADTTNFQIPFGIVVGINDMNQVYDTTGQNATGVVTQAAQNARDWRGVESMMYPKSDPQLLVLVEEIFPETVLQANIYNATLGTAPTAVADTAGTDTTGYTSAGTTAACDFTPQANLATIYCRTGANAGFYRKTSDTSTTAPVATVAFPNDVAKGDTFVRVPFAQGIAGLYIAGPGLFVDCGTNTNSATNTFQAMVLSMDLAKSGKETVNFRFCLDHFCQARA